MMTIDIKKIYEAPWMVQAILVGAVCLIVFYLGYNWDLGSFDARIKEGLQQQEDLKQQFKLSLSNRFAAETDASHLPKVKASLAEWRNQLSTTATLPELLDMILKLGNENSLKFSTFDPGAEIKDNIYTKIPVKITTKGTYDQIAGFISSVANMSKLVTVGDFSITGSAAADVSSSQVFKPINSDTPLTADLVFLIYKG